MEINLAAPYSSKLSPPAVPELAFWSPKREDLLFHEGTEIEIRAHAGIHHVGLRYELCRNRFTTPFATGRAEELPGNDFRMRFDTARLHAGFYDVRVALEREGAEAIATVCTFGWRVEEMKYRDTRPGDFHEFWSASRAKLGDIPLDLKEGETKKYGPEEIGAYNVASAALPRNYDPTGHKAEMVEAAKVSFASAGGRRVHGWLAKPPGKGPFPAMLVLPGAGNGARPMPLEHARHGFLALDVQIHGNEVDAPEYTRIPGYVDQFVHEPVEGFYFHRLYLNALQAVNYLHTRPEVDTSRIVVVGGSQGGRLSVGVAALDHRIAAAIPAITHHGNFIYGQWAERCNTLGDDGMAQEIPPPPVDDAEQRCRPYYDSMNFAPDVVCPVLMNAGLIDPVSHATGVFSVYQRLGSRDKEMIPLPGLGHDWSAEFDRRAWRWLERKIGI